jgi:hydroxypyruvate isomerase
MFHRAGDSRPNAPSSRQGTEPAAAVLEQIGVKRVADVPGRCEPGTGEINYPAIAAALADMGYPGTVGLEAWAADGDSDRALDRFRAAFTLPVTDGEPS